MARHFGNFLDAFKAYANDNFTPEQFDDWAGLSIIAGALERKVWLPWSDTYQFYPNLFILLVAKPGAGKSVAGNRAVGLLRELQADVGSPYIAPNQVTEARFIELMSQSSTFQMGTKLINQSAAYYFASEASNTLRNIYGDFIANLTDLYDCPEHWVKETKGDGNTTITNACINLLAGSTLEYLGKLVTAEQVMGGFASRLIYIVSKDEDFKEQEFQNGVNPNDPAKKAIKAQYRSKLLADLKDIHNMVGPFSATPEFGRAWQAWHSEFERERRAMESEKLQSLLVRVNGNLLKVSMALSAAESSDRVLRAEHWDRAHAMMQEPIRQLPEIFQAARAGDTESQDGLTQAIVRYAGKKISLQTMKSLLLRDGFRPDRIDMTIKAMRANGTLAFGNVRGSEAEIILTGDANKYM